MNPHPYFYGLGPQPSASTNSATPTWKGPWPEDSSGEGPGGHYSDSHPSPRDGLPYSSSEMLTASNPPMTSNSSPVTWGWATQWITKEPIGTTGVLDMIRSSALR